MGILTIVAYAVYIGAAALMVFAILLQEGKGGGLSALGGTPAESAFGATNPIRRMTVVLACLFFLLAGFLSYVGSRKRLTIDEEKPSAAAAPAESEAGPTADAEKPVAESEAAPPGPERAQGDAAAAAPTEKAESAEPATEGAAPTAPPSAPRGEE